MESGSEYLNFDNSYKSCYIRNNSFIKKGNPDTETLYYNVMSDVDIILTNLSISPSKHGYRYWKDAVFIYMTSDNPQISICNEIYPIIATKYGKTAMSVERAMRLCFEDAMYFASKKEQNYIIEFMKSSLLFPHNSKILCRLTELVVSNSFQKEKIKSYVGTYQN